MALSSAERHYLKTGLMLDGSAPAPNYASKLRSRIRTKLILSLQDAQTALGSVHYPYVEELLSTVNSVAPAALSEPSDPLVVPDDASKT